MVGSTSEEMLAPNKLLGGTYKTGVHRFVFHFFLELRGES
jgi:hypothetical protein